MDERAKTCSMSRPRRPRSIWLICVFDVVLLGLVPLVISFVTFKFPWPVPQPDISASSLRAGFARLRYTLDVLTFALTLINMTLYSGVIIAAIMTWRSSRIARYVLIAFVGGVVAQPVIGLLIATLIGGWNIDLLVGGVFFGGVLAAHLRYLFHPTTRTFFDDPREGPEVPHNPSRHAST